MATGHTDDRIRKLARRGLSVESIARKIGRPGDLERVRRALRDEKSNTNTQGESK